MVGKVCIYTRVSDVSQLQGSGLDGQESTCRDWADRNQMEVDSVFSDGGFSGKLRSRPDLEKMILYLEEKNKKFTTISLVLVDDFDRIIRDVQGWREIKLRIEGAGAKIFSLKQDLNDTPEGKMLQSITMATKQYERENNGRRVRDRQMARLKAGYWTFKQYPGYIYIKDPSRGGQILVPKQPDFDIIKEALTLFADGVLVNAKALQEYLNNKGIQSVEKCKIYLSLATRLITPKVLDHYLGYITVEKRGIERMSGKHPRMLTEAVVEKILDRVNPKKCYKDASPSEISEQLPLRSILKCEACGNPLTGAPTKKGNGNIYYYYTCRNRCKCSLYAKSFGNKEVHESIEYYLSQLTLSNEGYDTCHFIFQKIRDSRKSLTEDKICGKKKRFQEVGIELERIQERIFKTEDEKLISIYEKKLKELSNEQDTLTFSIEAFNTEIEGVNPVQTFEKGKQYLQNPRSVRERGDLKTKRLFIKAFLGENLTYNRKTGVQTIETPVLYIDNSIITGHNPYMVGDIGLEPMTPCL